MFELLFFQRLLVSVIIMTDVSLKCKSFTGFKIRNKKAYVHLRLHIHNGDLLALVDVNK